MVARPPLEQSTYIRRDYWAQGKLLYVVVVQINISDDPRTLETPSPFLSCHSVYAVLE